MPASPEGLLPRQSGCSTRLPPSATSFPRSPSGQLAPSALVRVLLQGDSLFSAELPSRWAWDQAGFPGAPGPAPDWLRCSLAGAQPVRCPQLGWAPGREMVVLLWNVEHHGPGKSSLPPCGGNGPPNPNQLIPRREERGGRGRRGCGPGHRACGRLLSPGAQIGELCQMNLPPGVCCPTGAGSGAAPRSRFQGTRHCCSLGVPKTSAQKASTGHVEAFQGSS